MSGRSVFSKRFEVRWADLDANRHLRNTAYLDYATHVRFAFLAENGFPPSRFGELHFGPVILREEMTFVREVGPNEELTVDYRLAALSEDGRKFKLRHRVFRRDGVEAARIDTDGGWMDLATRKLRPPPAELQAAFERLERTDDFEIF
jgi:acyl-CoA thioester hydrolase